jgi:hypothetical protein
MARTASPIRDRPAETDRETIIHNFPNGKYLNALRVLAFTPPEAGLVRTLKVSPFA